MVFKIIFVVLCVMNFSKSAIPDSDKSVTRLIEDYGYLVESHNIVTKDGYILEIHRIPGIRGSSADWVLTGPNRSLAFLLAENGYDVWLGNNRGNTFGKNHKSYLSTSFGFWDFSWHELGIYDLPATIDYILKTTKIRNLNYVCFSQGCTQFLVMGSLMPEYNKKIRFTAALAPASALKNIKGVMTLASPFISFSKILVENLGYFELIPSSSLLRIFTNYVCRENSGLQNFCYLLIFNIVGNGLEEIDRVQFPDVFSYFPAGCSWKQVIHYISDTKEYFGQYNYGLMKNLRLYNSTIPPEYPLKNVNVPIAIFHGPNDYLVPPQDVAILEKKLPNVVGRFFVTERKLNHLDFMFGRNIRHLVYNRVVQIINLFKID
ncbi:lipase 1-like isoform X2 [Belonocnema kinseyi]|uniref:lipase 1-like isoform X2 n=1 Tax=Belonocnema kinseyi TaxID=2817044 RepID=UPI00143DCE66|nr:lipase 1-like isoform X2 [Belonocnema kinseyi]